MGNNSRSRSLFWGACLLVLAGCATAPVTGRQELILVPFDQEVQMGAQAYQEILQSEPVSNDPAWTGLVQRVGQRIAQVSDMPKLNWEFKVIESKEINAFCLPGGKVAVYTGILPIAKTEAGLAAIIGHEVGHAVARHAGERMSHALLVNLGLSAADLSLQNSQYKSTILAAMGLGANVGVLLPYSRKQESESDHIGTVYMAKAGYDPREAVRLWERMDKVGGERPPSFLSTHPAPSDRIQELQVIAQDAMQYYQNAPKQYGQGELIQVRPASAKAE
ncbi:MAG: M48 family metallopeptidase [bacterium]